MPMNKPTKRYLRSIRKNLDCSFIIRRRLMKPFLHTLELYLEEKPDPYEEDLVEAFGLPQELAEFMMESVTLGQQTRYRVGRWAVRIVAAMLAVVILIITVAIYRFKRLPREYYDAVYEVTNAIETEEPST